MGARFLLSDNSISMNYSELKEIIKHIKKVIPCGNCRKKFNDDDIHVLSTFQNDALFYFHCHFCNNQLVVHVSIVEQGKKNNKINIQAQSAPKISTNEILDLHNFLNKFNGDFKELFLK